MNNIEKLTNLGFKQTDGGENFSEFERDINGKTCVVVYSFNGSHRYKYDGKTNYSCLWNDMVAEVKKLLSEEPKNNKTEFTDEQIRQLANVVRELEAKVAILEARDIPRTTIGYYSTGQCTCNMKTYTTTTCPVHKPINANTFTVPVKS